MITWILACHVKFDLGSSLAAAKPRPTHFSWCFGAGVPILVLPHVPSTLKCNIWGDPLNPSKGLSELYTVDAKCIKYKNEYLYEKYGLTGEEFVCSHTQLSFYIYTHS